MIYDIKENVAVELINIKMNKRIFLCGWHSSFSYSFYFAFYFSYDWLLHCQLPPPEGYEEKCVSMWTHSAQINQFNDDKLMRSLKIEGLINNKDARSHDVIEKIFNLYSI